ncbi:hypothetical protein [Candidatus Dormiibacter inghamiae]|uniref:hypothetical protein n=1 Tax=Candidatus Dormiibacter inghamiae TaxID=3127013 RepID=UPI0030C75C50
MSNRFCVNLTHGTDDVDRATVGFVVANAALSAGRETMIFLTIDAVRLAVRGHADGAQAAGFAPSQS